jgi:hypothetical protein
MQRLPYGVLIAALSAAVATAPADTFTIDWWTLDGGGDMWTTGGDFELSGTIGQPDAGVVMTGGDFELTGGFWPGAGGGGGPSICRGDLDCSAFIDFGDINPFVLALSNWPAWLAQYPNCPPENADVNGDGQYGGPNGFGDINPFVALLASGGGQPIPCP